MVSHRKRYGIGGQNHTFRPPIGTTWQKAANRLQNDRKQPIAKDAKDHTRNQENTSTKGTKQAAKTQTRNAMKSGQASLKTQRSRSANTALRLLLYQLGKLVISFRPSPYASSGRPARRDRQAMYLRQRSESAEHPAVAAADGHHGDGHRDAARPSPPRKCESERG